MPIEKRIPITSAPNDTVRVEDVAQPGLRARRRNRDCHHAILAAALKLVKERGYAGVTIEGIAGEAGVGKQTIFLLRQFDR